MSSCSKVSERNWNCFDGCCSRSMVASGLVATASHGEGKDRQPKERVVAHIILASRVQKIKWVVLFNFGLFYVFLNVRLISSFVTVFDKPRLMLQHYRRGRTWHCEKCLTYHNRQLCLFPRVHVPTKMSRILQVQMSMVQERWSEA